jgi:ribosomal-protein-alanine N-acetyltransferase
MLGVMQIQLVPASKADLANPSPALLAGLAQHFPTAAEGMAYLDEVLTVMGTQPRPRPWADWWALGDDGSIMGLCGFKGAPDGGGVVEIGYGSFPLCEGKGVATAMAAALIDMAARHGARQVIAHTLMAQSGSTTVLRRNGFAFVGMVVEPEDGEVWRWQRPLGPASATA